jgi:hypothetical protein
VQTKSSVVSAARADLESADEKEKGAVEVDKPTGGST